MTQLPARGARVRELPLALPPQPIPMWRRARLLKRWRYVGYYSEEVMLCVGDARVGPLPQRWWAIAEPGGTIRQKSSLGSAGLRMRGSRVGVLFEDVEVGLELEESAGVEVVTPVGDRGNYIWTRKQGDARVRGSIVVADREYRVDGVAFVDESAGYYPRHTVWNWSAGVGTTESGAQVAWNLVTGVHDSERDSERTLWLDGEPRELGAVRFADDLSSVEFAEGGALTFTEWSTREERMNLLLLRSSYRQPFGEFRGELPDGVRLTKGYGVMEEHDVLW